MICSQVSRILVGDRASADFSLYERCLLFLRYVSVIYYSCRLKLQTEVLVGSTASQIASENTTCKAKHNVAWACLSLSLSLSLHGPLCPLTVLVKHSSCEFHVFVWVRLHFGLAAAHQR